MSCRPAELFSPRPSTWGLRGDAFLWQEMKLELEGMALPSDELGFMRLLEELFSRLVGVSPHTAAHSTFVQRYDRGGTSSGQVSLDFWRKEAFPLLQTRYAERSTRPSRERFELGSLTVRELLSLSASANAELRKRGIVRTANNPVGAYTEWLVASALGLNLASNSATGFDAVSAEGVRFQIKGRRISSKNASRQLSAIRNLDAKDFDHLIAVVFDESYEILAAVQVPHAVVGDHAVFRQHVNAHILHVNAKLLGDSRVTCVRDVLARFQQPNPGEKAAVSP